MHGFDRFRVWVLDLHATNRLPAFIVPDYLVPVVGGGGGGRGSGAGAGARTVFPAQETNSGMLCIEIRIRLYHDGAMSKLLDSLAKVRTLKTRPRYIELSFFRLVPGSLDVEGRRVGFELETRKGARGARSFRSPMQENVRG